MMGFESLTTPRLELEALQLEKARALLGRALNNPFYGPRLKQSGLTPESLHHLSQWRELPTVDKADVLADQSDCPPFGHRLGVDRGAVRQIHMTSGTSGIGQEAMGLTVDDVEMTGRTWQPPFSSMGLDAGDTFITFYPVTFLTYGRSVMEGGRLGGIAVVPMGGIDRPVVLSLMRRLSPNAIGARPAMFRLLAEELQAADGVSPRDVFPEMKALICSGLSPSAAVLEQEAWGATVHELYGSSQAGGIIASTGPEGAAPDGTAGVMHCLEHHFLIEAVHPETLEPVEEGEAELLLTCLDRVASPIIRFRTRDRVEILPPGAHDGGVPRLGIRVGSVGRFDDMVKIRGNNVWPGQLDEALLGHPSVTDYQADVVLDERGVDLLVVKIRPAIAATAGSTLEEECRRRVKMATNVRPVVKFAPDLPPPALKPRRLIDRRRQGT
jgi:phenylacetate-CoA ligase